MTKFGIGQAITRREDLRLLTGKGSYVDDMHFPGEVHLVFLRSPHAHARIRSLDASAARGADGVLAVFTGEDLRAAGVGQMPTVAGFKRADGAKIMAPDYFALAIAEVRFVGEAVAAVVARSRLQAEDAVEQIQVDYEDLPAVASIATAMAPGAPLLHPDVPSNVTAEMAFGDATACDAAFAGAAHVARVVVDSQRLVPVAMEPRGTIARLDPDTGRLTLYTSCQNPAGLQKTLAEGILNVPLDSVRVVVGDVGGGFGMKTLLYPEDVVCAHAARALGYPVRWRASRSEEFLAGTHGRDQLSEGELALDPQGRVLGLRVRIIGNIGAYAYGPGTVINLAVGPKVITGVYHIPVLDLQSKAVLTNTNLVSAYRGAGRPEAIYLIERLMDEAAVTLGIDRAEVRRRNLIQPADMPYKTPMGEVFDSGNFPHMLGRVLELAHWDSFEVRRAESLARGRLRGHALSTFLEWTGVVHEETIDLHVEADGRIVVYTAMQAMGQGIETSYVQIIAQTLDVDPEQIVVVQGDSDVAQGIGSMGSRSLYIGGSAMFTASQQAVEKGRELASEALEVAGADLDYASGRFTVPGTDLGIGLFELAARQAERRIALRTTQTVGGPSWPNSAHVCEVEIDPQTGRTEILRYTTVDDVGRVVNPMIVAGQVHGGIAQAVGQALLENTRYDLESAQLLTGSFQDYCVPRADDLPNFSTHTDESTPCKINPLGAKGVGELGTVGGTPTVMNAVIDALRPLGVTDLQMPATPERIWRAIQAAQGARAA